MKKVIIAAVAENNVIGRKTGEMPWHSKEEFRHFKSTTLGFPIIMGRKTFISLEKPLKDRLNIVLSRSDDFQNQHPDLIVFNSLEKAYNHCENAGYQKIFIIGGSYIFNDAINHADEMIITRMNFEAVGDVYFPLIDENIWKVCTTDPRNEFRILYYKKKNDEC